MRLMRGSFGGMDNDLPKDRAMTGTADVDEFITVKVTRQGPERIKVEIDHIAGEGVEKEGNWSAQDDNDKIAEIIAGRMRIAISELIYKVHRMDLRLDELRNVFDKVKVDEAMDSLAANNPGGIDLNTSGGMQWKIGKDGRGVEMDVDPALIERVRRRGIDSLSPVIYRITPVANVWSLVGLASPK